MKIVYYDKQEYPVNGTIDQIIENRILVDDKGNIKYQIRVENLSDNNGGYGWSDNEFANELARSILDKLILNGNFNL